MAYINQGRRAEALNLPQGQLVLATVVPGREDDRFPLDAQGQDSETQLCRIAADRGEASALTRNKTSVSAFRWSPDG